MKLNLKFHLSWLFIGIFFIVIGLTGYVARPIVTQDTNYLAKLILTSVGIILFFLGIDINLSL